MDMRSVKRPLKDGMFVNANPVGIRHDVRRLHAQVEREIPFPYESAQGKTALVLGVTAGYGRAISLALRRAGFKHVIGVGYDTGPTYEPDGRLKKAGSAGFYAAHEMHRLDPNGRTTYLADAFDPKTVDRVVEDLEGPVDYILYSLASKMRPDHTGENGGQPWISSLKAIGAPLDFLKLDRVTGKLVPEHFSPATETDILHTVKVMGAQPLTKLWVPRLLSAKRLSEGVKVHALSYIGPQELEELARIYWLGTIGAAKQDIDQGMVELCELLASIGGDARSVVAPAIVTLASSGLPIEKYIALLQALAAKGVGLYLQAVDVAILYQHVMFHSNEPWRKPLADLGYMDDEGRLRLDVHEMDARFQARVQEEYAALRADAPNSLMMSGLQLVRRDYANINGEGFPEVNYDAACDVNPRPKVRLHDLLSAPTPSGLANGVVAPTLVLDGEEVIDKSENKNVEVIEAKPTSGKKEYLISGNFSQQQGNVLTADGLISGKNLLQLAQPAILQALRVNLLPDDIIIKTKYQFDLERVIKANEAYQIRVTFNEKEFFDQHDKNAPWVVTVEFEDEKGALVAAGTVAVELERGPQK